jgi:hypothetical protein
MDFDGKEERGDAAGAWLPDGRDERRPDESAPKPSTRWVQLAYDLEQYGDPDPDERGEVF